MTTRTLLTLLTLGSLLFGCAEAESLPGSGSQSGGKTSTDTSAPSEGGSSSAAKGGATGTAAATGGKTSTTSVTGTGGTTTNTTAVVVPTADCGTVTGDVTLTHSSRTGGETGGESKIVAAAGKTLTVGDLSLQYCFSTIGAATLTSSGAARIDSGGVQRSSDPYYTSVGTGITSSIVAGDASTKYCLVFDFSSATAAAALTLTGTDSISLNWVMNSTALGAGAMLDPRPEVTPQIIVINAGATAACVAAPI